jgi:2'-5' RNA ligase
MRVFSALFPPDEVVEEFSRVVAPLQRHYPELEWTPPPLWHMTLTYFGNLSLEDSRRLGHAMDTFAQERSPFQVRIDGAGATPNPQEGETLFAKLEAADNALLDLYLAGITAVQGFGWVLDRRRYRPHFPLARAEQPFNLTELVGAVGEYQSSVWEASSVAIVWARPGDDGRPYYELLGEHEFGGGAAVVPMPEAPAAVEEQEESPLARVLPLLAPGVQLPPEPPRLTREVASEACTPATVDW